MTEQPTTLTPWRDTHLIRPQELTIKELDVEGERLRKKVLAGSATLTDISRLKLCVACWADITAAANEVKAGKL